MEKSISYDQEIQQKVETPSSVPNGNQNHVEIHQLDQEAANTSSNGNGNHHRELVISIKEMAKSSLDPPLSSNKCCIYKVPTYLRKLNEEAYTPQVISIGPFHHGSKRLEPMEKLKLKYFQRFLHRIENFNVLDILVNAIKVHEEKVRGCYAETIKFSSDDFLKLILVDGCFLIEFFYSVCSKEINRVIHENQTLLNPISWRLIMLDLQLLENQLPFFAFEILFGLSGVPMHPSFTLLAIKVFEDIHDQEFPGNLGEQPIRHFVDLTKAFLLPSSIRLLEPPDDLPSADHLYSASQLYEIGVKFKLSSSKCLLDLKFTNGTLEIPCMTRMTLSNDTETIYRNVIAFEQCHGPRVSHLTDYIVLLNFLINTPKDAELLIRKGIIINCLANSGAVASLFHNLDTNLIYHSSTSAYRGLFRDLNAFYNNTKHTWKATLKRDYFGTPWKTASTAAAVIFLLLTLGQFICSIIQVVKM